MNNLLWVEGWRWNATESLTFFCCLVLAVLVSAGSPGTPWRHLTLNRAVNVAELGGVRGCTQTQVAVHWSHSYGRNEPQWVAHFHMKCDLVNCDICIYVCIYIYKKTQTLYCLICSNNTKATPLKSRQLWNHKARFISPAASYFLGKSCSRLLQVTLCKVIRLINPSRLPQQDSTHSHANCLQLGQKCVW